MHLLFCITEFYSQADQVFQPDSTSDNRSKNYFTKPFHISIHPHIFKSLFYEHHKKEESRKIQSNRIERSQYIAHSHRLKNRKYKNSYSYDDHISIDDNLRNSGNNKYREQKKRCKQRNRYPRVEMVKEIIMCQSEKYPYPEK